MRSFAKPITFARMLAWFFTYSLASGGLYFLVTHFPLGPVHIVQAGAIDALVPILPATVPFYLSYMLIMPVLLWLGHRKAWFLPVFFAGALATGLCLVIHLFWSSAIIRPASDSLMLAWLYGIDPSFAALPSGHVALPVAITVLLAMMRERASWLFGLWSVVLMLTVLTTGQHLFCDMAFGVATGMISALATWTLIRLRVDLRTVAALLLEWLCILVAMRMAIASSDWRVYMIAFVIIGSRQHALFILFHDAVHYHLCRNRAINDFLINFAVGVPGCVPIEFYRPLHQAHHRHVGSERDPERKFLYQSQPWQFRPLDAVSLVKQLLGDMFVLNSLRAMHAYRADGGRVARPTRALLAALATWLIIVALLVYGYSLHTVGLLVVLWIFPLVTVCVLLQKLRSFAEHSGGPGVTPGWESWTYCWRVGALGRFFVWPYHINLHLQHHRNPSVAWHQLSDEALAGDQMLSSHGLLDLLWSGKFRKY